jgi:PAS domain S-box-containing protein
MQPHSHKPNLSANSAISGRTTSTDQSTHEAAQLAELTATKEFLDKILTGLNDHYVVFDHQWRYVYANEAAARTLGVPKEKLIGNVIWELFPDAVGNQFYQELHRAREERKDFVSEHYYQKWNSWYENRYYVLPDGIAVLSIDITPRKRAEDAQRQSEQMLAFALESANMVAWEWDIARDLVKFSKADNHIYGASASYSSQESYKTVYPDDLAAHRAKVMQCSQDGRPYHSSYRIIRPDTGHINWVDEWGFAARNAEGEIYKLFGVTMESTERRETEERLQVIYQLSEAVNRAEAVEQIYDLALSGLERVLHVHRASILLFDQQGVMRFQAWRDLSERYRALTDGQLPRFINDAHPLPVLIPDVAHADLGGQEQNHLDEGIHAIAFIPLVEKQRLIGKFMLYYDQPHSFSEAEVQWAQTIARHVAHALERKQSEMRLQTYARTLEELNHIQLSLAAELDLKKLWQMITDVATELSGAQFGAFFYNVQPSSRQQGDQTENKGAYVLQALSGVAKEYVDGLSMPRITELFEPTFHGEGIIRLADVNKDERFGKSAPYFGLPPNHLPITSYMAVPVVSRSGKVIGTLFFGHAKRGIFTEQAEQLVSGIASQAASTLENARLYAQIKESEAALRELNTTLEQRVEQRTEELQRSNRELDQFAYVASHDLKAPLRAINHLATWLTEDASHLLPTASKEHLSKLQARVQRMEVLLDDLLAYSRAGRHFHPAEVVDITDLLNNVIDIVAPPAGFTIKIVGKLPVLRVERAPLETVFRNLIGNAIKHHPNPAEGIVKISANTSKQHGEQFTEFVVEDNGNGIAPEYHDRIFEMFQTLKPRDLVEGSGLGLAVVKRAVESRGGTIQVESKLGEGATFRFTWPRTASSYALNT